MNDSAALADPLPFLFARHAEIMGQVLSNIYAALQHT